MYPEPLSDSCAEDIMLGITLLLTCTGALLGGAGSVGLIGKFGLSDKKKCPPPLDQALGSLR